MSEFDAIFVGAGHNSLACAAHLALKGWKTAVFERSGMIGGAVRTGEFTLPGFGKLVKATRKAREGRNPATGEPIKIAAKTTVKFRLGKALKDAVGTK